MPTLRFTDNIQRHVECPACEVSAASVREALDAYFAGNPRARRYVLDEHGGLRRHMVIFVDGAQIRDRDSLTDPCMPGSTIDIMQALSGG